MEANFYRPACLVRLQIRLEDFLPTEANVQSEDKPFEPRLQTLIEQERQLEKKLFEGKLLPEPTYLVEEAKLRSVKKEIDALKARQPVAKATDESQGDIYSVSVLTSPLSADTELNTYRSLDTLGITIPFRDAPLESQLIRSCLIECFAGTVTASEFGSKVWSLPLDKGTILFRGYVDNWKTNHDGEDAVVEISARSLECVLVDSKVDPRSPLYKIEGKSEKISAYVNRVMKSIPATSARAGADQLRAVYYTGGDPNIATTETEPTLDQAVLNRLLQTAKSKAQAANTPPGDVTVLGDAEGANDTNLGQVLGTGQPRIPGQMIGTEMSAWDLIVQACGLAGGLVPTYDPSLVLPLAGSVGRGDFILIKPPQTIYANVDQGLSVEGGVGDPFERTFSNLGKGGSAAKSQIRFMVWGRNIRSFSTERKLGRQRVPAVEVVATNPDAPAGKRLITVRYPIQKRTTSIGPKGEGKSEEVVRKFVRGVRDEAVLQQMAVALYHAIGRNELTVTIETDDMVSYVDPAHPDVGNQNLNDILKIRHGTPVRVAIAQQSPGGRDVAFTPLSDIFERRTSELGRFLLEQRERFDPSQDPATRKNLVQQQVQKMAAAINNGKRTDLFYVKSIKHHFDSTDGWNAIIELINFLEVRNLPKNLGPTDRKLDAARRPHAKNRIPTPEQVARNRALASRPR